MMSKVFVPIVAAIFVGNPSIRAVEAPFVRGDVDGSGTIDISDPVSIFSCLFLGGKSFSCWDAADSDDSGGIDITDGIYLLSFSFLGGAEPKAPQAGCGSDPTPDGLGCASFDRCEGPAVIDPSIKGIEVLGRGTDVFESYAVESNVKGQVLDVAALNAAGQLVFNPDVEERIYTSVTGSTVSEYASRLGVSVGISGSYKFFSADIKASFDNENYRRQEFSFATIMESVWKHSLKVKNDLWYPEYLRPYLTAEARNAIDNLTPYVKDWKPEDVLASFGTHVVVGLYVGARLDYHLSIKCTDSSQRQKINAYASARFKAAFASASIETEIDSETYKSMSSLERTERIRSKGGASQYASPQSDTDYNLWHASIDDYPVYCGIIRGALVGIWELASDPARRAALEAAYNQYAEGKESEFDPIIPEAFKITDVLAVDSTAGRIAPAGYDFLRNVAGEGGIGSNGYVNSNTRFNNHTIGTGNHIFIYYKREFTAAPGIDELHLWCNSEWINGFWFDNVPHDSIYDGVVKPACFKDPTNFNTGNCRTSKGRSSDFWCTGEYAECDEWNPYEIYLHHTKGAGTPIQYVVMGDDDTINTGLGIAARSKNLFWGPWEDINDDGNINLDDAQILLDHTTWCNFFSLPQNMKIANLHEQTWNYWLSSDGAGCYTAHINVACVGQRLGFAVVPK